MSPGKLGPAQRGDFTGDVSIDRTIGSLYAGVSLRSSTFSNLYLSAVENGPSSGSSSGSLVIGAASVGNQASGAAPTTAFYLTDTSGGSAIKSGDVITLHTARGYRFRMSGSSGTITTEQRTSGTRESFKIWKANSWGLMTRARRRSSTAVTPSCSRQPTSMGPSPRPRT